MSSGEPGGGGGGGECAPLGRAGLRGAGVALVRPRGGRAQPDAARFCPAAAEAAERFQTCSVSRPARVDATMSERRRGDRKEAAARRRLPRRRPGKAGAPLLNRSRRKPLLGFKAPSPQPQPPRRPWRSRVPQPGTGDLSARVLLRSLPALGTPPR